MKMGPSPLASIDSAMESLRPSNLASCEMRVPIRPPPMTMAESLVVDERAADE